MAKGVKAGDDKRFPPARFTTHLGELARATRHTATRKQEIGAWEFEGMARRYAHLAPAHLAPHAEIVANLLGGTSAAQSEDESKLTTS